MHVPSQPANGVYTVKYINKNTQHDNERPYQPIVDGVAKVMAARRKHKLDTQESIRTVMVGAAIQNKTNIVGASMTSFLTRNPSRFLFSHELEYFLWMGW
mmetsp:Transcript_23438/g.50808  ORF Transcript_23438/g.50808 Transcript_23438/m.50808 type:complete len:100 (+) Transcript_23438:666-965(+)